MLTTNQWYAGSGMREIEKPAFGSWVDLAEPTTDELDTVKSVFKVPEEFLSDPLDKDERARLEFDEETQCALIVLRAPLAGDEEEEITTVPYGIVIAPAAVITVCARRTQLSLGFTEQMRRVCPPHERHRFVFQLLNYSAILYLRHLRELRDRADQIERDLQTSMKNETLIDLMNLQKSLVYFTTSLKSIEIMLGRLRNLRQLGVHEDDLDYLDDATIEYKQALEMATIHSNILTGLMDAYGSVISNNLNTVMKFLTSVTIILMLPTLVASIYGMNITLPLQDTPHAFVTVMGIAIISAIVATIFFIRRKMF